jgi:hypothetical protein
VPARGWASPEQEPLDELVRAFVEDDLKETRRDRGL